MEERERDNKKAYSYTLPCWTASSMVVDDVAAAATASSRPADDDDDDDGGVGGSSGQVDSQSPNDLLTRRSYNCNGPSVRVR